MSEKSLMPPTCSAVSPHGAYSCSNPPGHEGDHETATLKGWMAWKQTTPTPEPREDHAAMIRVAAEFYKDHHIAEAADEIDRLRQELENNHAEFEEKRIAFLKVRNDVQERNRKLEAERDSLQSALHEAQSESSRKESLLLKAMESNADYAAQIAQLQAREKALVEALSNDLRWLKCLNLTSAIADLTNYFQHHGASDPLIKDYLAGLRGRQQVIEMNMADLESCLKAQNALSEGETK